ncbi:hypothetical protein LXJ58_34485, partial [Escherichia coli]|nr:hypothetical protein [Escherichia coli]
MIVDMRADAGSSSHAEHAAIAPHRHADDTLDLIGPDDAWTLEAEPEAAPRRWVLPAAALALSLLWLGGMLWLVRNDIRLLPPVGL